MNDELHVDAPPEELWSEIFRLRAAVKGPDGFASWYDAAIHERVLRTKAMKDALRYRAVRYFKDARDSRFMDDCDVSVDGFLKHLEKVDHVMYEALKTEIGGDPNAALEMSKKRAGIK